jgi:hypothetical protein
MNEAAAAMEFERAAMFRDRLDSLRWLHHHLERLRQAIRLSCVYPVDNHDGTQTWYLIHHGLVRAAAMPPTAKPVLDEVFAARAGTRGTPGLDEIDGVLLVAAWFRRHPEERLRTMDVAAAGVLAEPALIPSD